MNGQKLYSPLHVAAEWGRDSTVSLLVQLRAEVNMANNEGKGTSRDKRMGGIAVVLIFFFAKVR